MSVWTCASFAPPLLLVLSILFTLDGFVNGDKYAVVLTLFGVAPLVGALLLRHRALNWLQLHDVLVLNLSVTLIGALALYAKARHWTAHFDPWLFAAGYLASFALLAFKSATVKAHERFSDLLAISLVAVTPALLVAATIVPAVWLVAMPFDAQAGVLGALVAVTAILVWHQGGRLREGRGWRWVAPFVIVAAPLAMMDAELNYDALHYTAYLAPAAAVASGRIPLIDVFCQYGQAYLAYAAAMIWLPWTYGAAALVTAVANVLYTVCFLIILRKMVRHQAAFAILAASLPVLFWLSFHYSPNATPSQGGMRYLPVLMLAAALVWLPPSRVFSTASVGAMLLCWAFSFEAALYGTFVYVAFAMTRVASECCDVRSRLMRSGRHLLRLAALFAGFVLVVGAGYLLFAGQLPRYDLYVSMILSYVGPDPFMEYTFYKDDFFGWVPLVVMLFPVVCLIVWQLLASERRASTHLAQFAVIAAVTFVTAIYGLISTQGFTLKPALLPALVLLYAGLDRAIAARREGSVSASEIGVAPVLVLMFFLLAGTAFANFRGPPVYATPNGSVLRHLLWEGRPLRADAATHLTKVCNPPGFVEAGNVCTGDQNIPPVHYQEFASLVAKWQAGDGGILVFHPADAVLNAALGRPHVLPVSFSYTDGFSPALFRYIRDRAAPVIKTVLRPGQTVLVTKDLLTLNELEWALLKSLNASWPLERVDESDHFAVYRLARPNEAREPLIQLPDRPVKTRNSF